MRIETEGGRASLEAGTSTRVTRVYVAPGVALTILVDGGEACVLVDFDAEVEMKLTIGTRRRK